MKKIAKVLTGIVVLIIAGLITTGLYLKYYLPHIQEAGNITIDSTPERIEQGRYLANHVAVCIDCHSSRDWSVFSGPINGNLGGGGEKFGKEMGFPGTIYAKNITPYNLGNWTDGELLRAITTGVNKDGKALFSLMPYHHYGQMDIEDLYNIIAYIRTLKPIESRHPDHDLDFPVNLLINTLPHEANFSHKPAKSNVVAYGQYLVNAAGCVDCHSKTEKGAIIPGTEFGGGMEFQQPGGIVRSANITPHQQTGIGSITVEDFVQRFQQYTDSSYHPEKLSPGDLNTPMPWTMYSGMTTDDLKAIYAYLQSLSPIDNMVNHFEKK